MAYVKRRRPARYGSRAGGRRRNDANDSFAGVTLVQILLTLCLISALYLVTLSSGNFGIYVKTQAKQVFSEELDPGAILEVMGDLVEMTPLGDVLMPGGESTEADRNTRSDDTLGEAVFTGTPQPELPLRVSEPISGETAGAEDPLGAGGMLLIDEGSFKAPDSVVTSPVYLSVRLRTPTAGTVTSPFGFRTHPITGKWDFHTGVDIAAVTGTDVLAALPGIVSEVGYSDVYGNYIIIDHGAGVQTGYSHCHTVVAKEGQRIGMGARIATVGSTGISTGPHLHFELVVDGYKADPLPHLRTAVVS